MPNFTVGSSANLSSDSDIPPGPDSPAVRSPPGMFFPNPSEHASALIEACGTLALAREMARTNVLFATTDKDFRYWRQVSAALRPEAECLAN